MIEHAGYTPDEVEALSPEELIAIQNELWARGQEIVVGAPQLFIDTDVEADGVAGYGSMRSVGLQSPTGESFYSEIKPYDSNYMDGHHAFCEEHGLERARLLREAPELEQVMIELYSWLTSLHEKYDKPPVFTAFNAGFDWGHVDLGFALTEQENPFGHSPYDLKSLAVPVAASWDWSLTSKSKLPKIIVPTEEFTHHALKDAQWQQKLHFGLAALFDVAS